MPLKTLAMKVISLQGRLAWNVAICLDMRRNNVDYAIARLQLSI